MQQHEETQDDQLTAAQAATVLSKNNGREIKPQYLNQLVRQGKITAHKLDARTNLYRRGDLEGIIVASRGGKHKQDHSRRTRGKPTEK